MRARRSLWLLPVLALVVLSSCSKKTPATRTTTTTASITTTVASPCAFTGDFVSPSTAPLINVQQPGGPAVTVTVKTAIICATVVTVDQVGAADVVFGEAAACQLSQDNPGVKVATMITRDPATVVFRLGEGRVRCTLVSGQPPFDLCGLGSLLATGDVSSAVATCDSEPVFEIEVFSGTFDVTSPAGPTPFIMGQGQSYSFDFGTGQETFADATFDRIDKAAFGEISQFVKTG